MPKKPAGNGSPRRARKARGQGAITVRMYRVGFGDCFLVSLPVEGGQEHILVDCGAHPQAAIKNMSDVVEDIFEVTGGRLALVVASHEHADHISGFGACEEQFSRFQVGEIWMPWAMDPEDRTAAETRRHLLALAAQLEAHFAASPVPHSEEARQALLNIARNETSMRALRSRFRGAARRIRYLHAGDKVRPPRELKGLEVRVVGPPSDPEYLKKMDPPGHERYVGGELQQSATAIEPFPAQWWWTDRALARACAGWTEEDEVDLRGAGNAALDHVAFAIDHALNNTSLVLLFTFRGQRLLFPGDAQYGNWKAWLDEAGSKDLLSGVSFLKVAHHGSHNATPKSALEALPEGFAAMVSTQGKPWKSIPQPELMDRLGERSKGRVVRGDALHHPDVPDGDVVAELPKGFRRNALSIEYTLPL